MATNMSFSAIVDRTQLGLGSLDLNDHVNYYVSSQSFMGGSISWQRNQVSSPFIDGQITTYRTRQMVTEGIGVEVLGRNKADLANKIAAVVTAFCQDTFNLQLAYDTTVYQFQCEAADYTVGYQGERWIANQVLVQFQVPRQPIPTSGVI